MKKKAIFSRLNGRVYAAAGQTVASLHTKAYQTDLLKDLDKVLYNPGLSPNNQGSEMGSEG